MRSIALLGFFFVSAGPALAENPKFKTPEQLKALEFVIGTWDGRGELPGVGKFADEYVFRWNETHTLITASYVMVANGQIVWKNENTIGWDPEAKKLVGFTFGHNGSIGRCSSTEPIGKDGLIMEGTSVGDALYKVWRTTLTPLRDGTMNFVLEQKKDGAWSTVVKVNYRKVRD